MKIFAGIVMIMMLGICAFAQQDAKIVAEMAASAEKIVRNSPFSAEAVSESVQTLADGNRIVHSTTTKLYRNSEGRFRRDMSNGSGGIMGTYYSYGPGITILDPVGGLRYVLDTKLKTAEQALLRANVERATTARAAATEDQRAAMERLERVRTEQLKGTTIEVVTPAAPATPATPAALAPLAITAEHSLRAVTGVVTGGMMVFGPEARSKYESTTDQLGVQNIEGIEAEGTRTTTIIPAGAIGNERPIEVVYEKWYSKELQLVVMSRQADPRFGETTYKLTNINRSEPDPSLFAVPAGYKVVSSTRAPYKVSTTAVKATGPAPAKTTAQGGATTMGAKP